MGNDDLHSSTMPGVPIFDDITGDEPTVISTQTPYELTETRVLSGAELDALLAGERGG